MTYRKWPLRPCYDQQGVSPPNICIAKDKKWGIFTVVHMYIRTGMLFYGESEAMYTVRKKSAKIECSMNICWWGGGKVIYRWHSMIYDFHSTPSTNIHWQLIFRWFFLTVYSITVQVTTRKKSFEFFLKANKNYGAQNSIVC